MEDLTISKGWFQDKDDEPPLIKKKFCEHRVNLSLIHISEPTRPY